MQQRTTALNPGLLAGIVASVLLHGALLHARARHLPAEAQFDSGEISVELTLMPSIASVAAAEPVKTTEPQPDPIEEPVPEPIKEPAPPEPVQQEMPEPSVDAVEQDGSLEEDKGVLADAVATSPCCPVYPPFSRRRGEEGVVLLALEINADGKVTHVRIEKSSNHKRLDKAAVKAAWKARFSPATRFGKPCASTLVQTFTFKLTND
ncbi:MAG: TonB family protein [Verrucomicrobiota bacterium]